MTSQFDVCRYPGRGAVRDRPYVLVVQTRFLDHLKTRVCAPLVVPGAFFKQTRLNPMLRIEGKDVFLSPTELATFPLHVLATPVANLEADRDKIVAALDLVFTGI
jgi:hypothetical protein